MAPDKFNTLTEDQKFDILRAERIEKQRRISRIFDEKNGRSGGFEHYLVFANQSGEPALLAGFHSQAYAKLFGEYIRTQLPVSRKPSKEKVNIEIDKFVELMKEGKKPFNVSLTAEGEVFHIDEIITEIYEPRIASSETFDSETNKSIKNSNAGISGTFWAFDEFSAIELAEEFLFNVNSFNEK